MRKVKPGQKLQIPAQAYNAFIDAAQYVRNRQEVGGHNGGMPSVPNTVLVRNASISTVQRHSVLGITGVEMDPSSSLPIAYSDPVLTCDAPVEGGEGKFVITDQPIEAGGLGWAYIDGACWAKVIVQTGTEDYEYADPYPGVTAGLVAVTQGTAKILWKAAGTGLVWAVVRLGVGGDMQVRPVKIYKDGPEAGTVPLDGAGGFDETDSSWHSCSFTYEVRELNGTLVIATDKTPKKARNANTAYRAAASGTLGLWDVVNEELLIAYDETELTTTACSE
ncbi:MAG: hypothetical protein ACOC95_00775 [Planctomycetota bacterium]